MLGTYASHPIWKARQHVCGNIFEKWILYLRYQ